VDELVKLVSERTGLPPDQAKAAVDTVVGFLKERLPQPIAGQVDALIAGAGAQGGAADLLGGLGGLFGKG
jgi:hypothetical protein